MFKVGCSIEGGQVLARLWRVGRSSFNQRIVEQLPNYDGLALDGPSHGRDVIFYEKGIHEGDWDRSKQGPRH